MISKLTIENFQSHKKTEMNFHPGINIITGPSDVGKSATVRALKWVALNRPSGDKMRRHHTKKTTVTLDEVSKTKTASKHQYKTDGSTMKALNRDIPPMVASQLNLSEVNFQEQHDTYFLIADPPGQVARTLNQVADLQVIDLSLKSIKQKVRESNAQRKFLETQMLKKEQEVNDLLWVRGADLEYAMIEKTEAHAAGIDTSDLGEAIETVRRLESQVSEYPDTHQDIDLLQKAEQKLEVDDTLSNLVNEINENQVLIPDPNPDIKAANTAVAKLGVRIDSNTSTTIKEFHSAQQEISTYPEIDAVEGIENLKKLTNEYEAAEQCVTQLIKAEVEVGKRSTAYNKSKEEFNKRIRDAGVCPLCEQEIT